MWDYVLILAASILVDVESCKAVNSMELHCGSSKNSDDFFVLFLSRGLDPVL